MFKDVIAKMGVEIAEKETSEASGSRGHDVSAHGHFVSQGSGYLAFGRFLQIHFALDLATGRERGLNNSSSLRLKNGLVEGAASPPPATRLDGALKEIQKRYRDC